MSWIVAERVDGVRKLFPESQIRSVSYCVTKTDTVIIVMTDIKDPGFMNAAIGCRWASCVQDLMTAMSWVAHGLSHPDRIPMLDARTMAEAHPDLRITVKGEVGPTKTVA